MGILIKSILGPALVLAGVAAMPIIACSSSNDDASSSGGVGDEGGIITPGGEGGADSEAPLTPCAKNADCPSKICNLTTMLCAAPSPTDGVQNEDETDIDCGGTVAKKCDQSKKCLVAGDCSDGVCKDTGTGLICQPPSNTDGVKNGNETGIDCGGTGNPTCPDGQGCAVRADCKNLYCKAGICTAPAPADGVQDGNETDVDCGGVGSTPCADGLKCLIADDCTSDVCSGGKCQVPTHTDMAKNGDETDVDCGGPTAPNACATGLKCIAGSDCTSGGCDYNKLCAIRKSCTGHYGGDTCGFGGDGSVGAAMYESCCATADVPSTAPDAPAGGMVHLSKYQVTAGRYRAFLESVSGNVRTYIQTARTADAALDPADPDRNKKRQIPLNPSNTAVTVLESAWDPYLPTSFTGDATETPDCDLGGWNTTTKACNAGTQYTPMYTAANNHVGPTVFKANSQPTLQGCNYASPGTHMYWLGAKDYFMQTADYAQSVYDEKPMQCVDQMMAQAFCVWDGGRLETLDEWSAAWGAGAVPYVADSTFTPKNQGSGTNTLCRFPSISDAKLRATPGNCPTLSATQTIEYADWEYSYEWPGLLHDNNDFSPFVSPPGRTRGRGPSGHADVLGNLLEMTSNVQYNANPFSASATWTGNGSWEVHEYRARQSYGNYAIMDKYGKQGLRCVYTR